MVPPFRHSTDLAIYPPFFVSCPCLLFFLKANSPTFLRWTYQSEAASKWTHGVLQGKFRRKSTIHLGLTEAFLLMWKKKKKVLTLKIYALFCFIICHELSGALDRKQTKTWTLPWKLQRSMEYTHTVTSTLSWTKRLKNAQMAEMRYLQIPLALQPTYLKKTTLDWPNCLFSPIVMRWFLFPPVINKMHPTYLHLKGEFKSSGWRWLLLDMQVP